MFLRRCKKDVKSSASKNAINHSLLAVNLYLLLLDYLAVQGESLSLKELGAPVLEHLDFLKSLNEKTYHYSYEVRNIDDEEMKVTL